MKRHQLSVEVHCPEEYMRTQKFKQSALVEALMGFFQFKLEDLDCAIVYTAREGPSIEYSIRVIMGTQAD
jgi:hypothetical protein